jgi:hypothetical protein
VVFISQKTAFFIVTAVITSDLTLATFFGLAGHHQVSDTAVPSAIIVWLLFAPRVCGLFRVCLLLPC